ncbi:helix-turn-helix domain-containing protein [Enterococcus sp. AZ192]|uniref:helix-turn-helix domain-containing protein n=1 Tax=unclassified Enterococcus TaxID=2608891 RepID=UPI003D2BA2FF
MNVNETLLFFRQNMKFTQKEVLPYHDTSAYSRIESGKREIKMSELTAILNKLSISPEEFICHSSLDDDQKKFRQLFEYCATHLTNQSKKKELLHYYNQLKNIENQSLKERSNFIAIKVFFSNHWSEVEQVTKEGLNDSFTYLSKKSYYVQYDYTLMSNIIFLLEEQQAELLIRRAIPIKDEENRNTVTKQFAYNLITNLITSKLYSKEYGKVQDYLVLAKKQNPKNKNYKYHMTISYLENLYLYLTKGDYTYIKSVYDYIHILHTIGEEQLSIMTEKEVEQLTLARTDSPINTMKVN